MKKLKRKQRKRRFKPRPKQKRRSIPFNRNPGVSSLLLVNPTKAKPAPRVLDKAALAKVVGSEIRKAFAQKKAEKPMPKKRRRRRRRAWVNPARRSHAAHVSHAQLALPGVAPKKSATAHRPRRRRTRSRKSAGARHMASGSPSIAAHYKGIDKYLRKGPFRGKNDARGLKALDRARRSILWNMGKGSPGGQQWVKDHIPRVNPGDKKAIALKAGLGIASFLGPRVVSFGLGKLPFMTRLGGHAAVLATAATAIGSYFLAKAKPHLKEPLMYGSAFALLDAVLKNWIEPHLPPSIAGALGACDASWPTLSAYDEPMGYLPAYSGYDGYEVREAMADAGDGMGMDVHPAMADAGDSMGMDVHAAMADAGDGMGMDAHEAQAGVEGYGAYVPSPLGITEAVDGFRSADEFGAYYPSGTGAYVPAGESMGEYLPVQGMGDSRDNVQDAAAFIFGGGPAGLAQMRATRKWQHSRHPRNRWPRSHHGRPVVYCLPFDETVGAPPAHRYPPGGLVPPNSPVDWRHRATPRRMLPPRGPLSRHLSNREAETAGVQTHRAASLSGSPGGIFSAE